MNIEKLKQLLQEFDYEKNSNENLYYFLTFIIDEFFSTEYISKKYLVDLYNDLVENENENISAIDLLDDLILYIEERI